MIQSIVAVPQIRRPKTDSHSFVARPQRGTRLRGGLLGTVLAALPAVLVALTTPVAATAAGSPLALVGATVIPVTGEGPIPDAVVVIDENRIVQVGPRGEVTIPADARRIDLDGKWITPGLVDTNVHLILMTVPEFFVKYEDRLADVALQSAQVGLKYGLTTMADSWGPLEPLLEARDQIRSGRAVGSRVLVAGNIVGLGGPFSPYFMGGWDLRGPDLRYGGWVHPMIRRRIDRIWEAGMGPELLAMVPEEAAEAMRRYIARGVDFVKVAVSGHGIAPVEPLMFSPAVLRAMREEARRAGVPFQTHTFTLESLRLAIELDPDMLQHPNVMNPPVERATARQRAALEELIAEVAERGISCGLMSVPVREQDAIYRSWNPSEHPDTPFLNRVMTSRRPWIAASSLDARYEALRLWTDAGIHFTLATDQGPEAAELGPVVWGRLGRAHFERLEGLRDAGLPAAAILRAATRNGAEAYGLGERLGTIEEGKLADLLVVDGDPLDDISNLRAIHMVLKDGRIVDRGALPTVRVLDYDPEAEWPY